MSTINLRISAVTWPLAIFGFLALSGTASAGVIMGLVNGNDCAGIFGESFDTCDVDESPVIAKFQDEDFGSIEINTEDFPTIDGSEWDFSGSGTLSGQFIYSPDDLLDPGIRFWAVKSGSQFKIHYIVPDDEELETTCTQNILNPNCLAQALVVPTDTALPWSTGTQMGISHITFYDTGNGDITRMPVPGTLALLALGGLSLAVRRRRTR